MKKFSLIIFLVIFLCFNLAQVFGQPEGLTTHQSQEIHKEDDSHFHRHHFAVFIGATSQLEGKETHFTLGLDYSIRPFSTMRFGIGVFGEAIMASHTEWLLGFAFYYYLTENIWVRTGPGIEMSNVESEHGDHETESHKEFLYRIGMGYHFDIAGFAITPSIDVDIVDGKLFLVFGLSIGKSF